MNRILGIDPGYGRVGWGIIEGNRAEWKHLAHGCIKTDPKKSLAERLVQIEKELNTIIVQYKPTHAGVEELYFAKNVTTGLKVAHARGVMVLALQKAKIPMKSVTPLQVKQSVTGYGKADKKQVQHMVALILGLKEKSFQDDAADALAVALYIGAIARAY